MTKKQRSDEEQVYDVHGFIERYIATLNTQQIPFKKEQIGVLEHLLLAENPVPVRPLQEDARERLLNQIVHNKSLKYYNTTIWTIDCVPELAHKERRAYTNRDFLELYEYCMRDYPNVTYPGNRGFGPLKLRLLGEYLRQKELLPPEQKETASIENWRPKDL